MSSSLRLYLLQRIEKTITRKHFSSPLATFSFYPSLEQKSRDCDFVILVLIVRDMGLFFNLSVRLLGFGINPINIVLHAFAFLGTFTIRPPF
jgi:hypothetical protein